jgi:hypothetical protein
MTAELSTSLLATPFFSSEALPDNVRLSFIDAIWPEPSTTSDENMKDFDAYFDVVQRERSQSLARLHAIQSFQDLVDFLGIIIESSMEPFAEILARVQTTRPESSASEVSMSIELAIRLWLMLDIRHMMPTHRYQLETSIPWPESQSLVWVLENHLEPSPSTVGPRYSEYLNLYDMDKMGGFKVEWTNNLASHLKIKGSVIYVFHHVSVLRRMLKSDTLPPCMNPGASMLTPRPGLPLPGYAYLAV